MDQPTSILKKIKRLNRRGKLIGSDRGLNEKEELVHALMAKCDKTEEEVLEAFDAFYIEHEEGFITKEEYTSSKSVRINGSINLFSNIIYFPGVYESQGFVQSVR